MKMNCAIPAAVFVKKVEPAKNKVIILKITRPAFVNVILGLRPNFDHKLKYVLKHTQKVNFDSLPGKTQT